MSALHAASSSLLTKLSEVTELATRGSGAASLQGLKLVTTAWRQASIEPAQLEKLVRKNVGVDTSSEASKKVRGHECPICGKVFSSGQALGGRKRSHLVASSGGGGLAHRTIVIQQQPPGMPDLLDLNLPAPTDEGSNNTDGNLEFRSWWVGRNHEHESLACLISN